jgi:mono/diheme cytochrome c family protein
MTLVVSAGLLLRVAAVALMLTGCARERDIPQSGDILYRRYCACCHGQEGRGDGPAAAALSPSPPDLTRVTSDIPELMRWIDGRRTVRAHGTAAMPVWGEVFEQSLIDEPHQRRTALLKVQALADYVYHLRERGR